MYFPHISNGNVQVESLVRGVEEGVGDSRAGVEEELREVGHHQDGDHHHQDGDHHHQDGDHHHHDGDDRHQDGHYSHQNYSDDDQTDNYIHWHYYFAIIVIIVIII